MAPFKIHAGHIIKTSVLNVECMDFEQIINAFDYEAIQLRILWMDCVEITCA